MGRGPPWPASPLYKEGRGWPATPPPIASSSGRLSLHHTLSGLRRSPAVFFLHHHHHAVVLLDVGGDLPHLRCPLERERKELHRHRTRDRVRKCCRIAAPGTIVYTNNEINLIMAPPSINFNQFLEKEKLKGNGSNFTDWSRHVRIFLTGVSMQYVLEAPLGPPPPPAVSEDIKNVYETRVTRYSEIQCAILCSLEAELQKRFEHHDPCEMMRELKLIFETHAAVESYEASKQFFNCMMEEGSSVSEHMFAMSGHAKKLSDLGIVIPNKLGIHRVLQSLPPSYKNFVMNYNMQNMNKELPELFSMLKSAEVEIKKENQVLMVNKTTSFKKQGKPNKGNFKKGGKKVAAPPEKPKAGDTSPTSNVDPNNVPLASLVAQEENVDVNFIKNNNFNNNAYRNNSGNNYRPYPSANGNGYGNSYGNSYNNNRSVPSGLEAMLKEFISTQTAFNKSVEEKLDKIDTIASRVDRLASDVNLLKLKVMPNNDIDNKITTTANAIQVRINENIRLMAELRARWDREENEKLAKENNVAKVWTITTTSNANSSHVAAPPTINGKIIGVGNVSTPSAKRTKLPEIAKTAETACDKTAEIFSNLGDNDPIAVAHNDLDFDDCHISEVIKFLQKLAKSPNASAINLAFTKHITNALIKAREEKLKLETSIPRKLEDGWEPIIKMKFNDFECNALCDLGASISVMPKKIYDMLDLPPLKNCYLDVNLADNVKKKPLGRIDNVHITVNNNLVPVDFVVLDIECNASCPIVLGRPFLRTVGAVIDMREAAGGTFMSITLGAATKLLDDMMINYSEWHTERAPQGKKVNSVEETSSLSDKIDVIMSMLVNGRSNVDPNNVPLASLVAQEENVDVNFIKNNNFNNNAYRNNSGNNYRPYPSANGNGYGNSYGNSYNNNRSVPSGLEAMLKEFISTQTAFNKSVEEKLDKIDTIASRVDRLASDVNLLKLKVMPNNDIDNKITTTANAIQVRINENIRLMAELRARWDREENEKLAKENNVAKVWTITTTSNANSSHVAAPPTINGKIIGVGNVSTPSAKRTKLPEIAKTAETACDKTAEIFSNLGDNDPIAVAHNDLDFDDCHISEVIKFLQKLAKSPNASAINLAFTKHITNALIKAREEKLKLETSIPRKLEDGWEPIIKMKFNDFECNALCDLGASISVMPKKIYDMLDLPPLKNCYLDVNLADNVKKKPLGRIDNVHITVNNNLVPVDFVVLDIECNASCPIVLGRPFLRTVGAVIDMREGSALAPESLVLRRITFRDHQPSTCFLAPTGSIKPWFLSEGKLATVRIIPSSWGSQRTCLRAGPKPETVCYYCQGKGHWKRNCTKYLADLKSGHAKKKGIFDIHVIDVYLTGSRSSELRNKRSLARDEVTMRVGNGSKVDVIAVGTLPLHLPSGLVLNLNNCYLVPALSMNIISGSCLMQDGYSFKSENNGCSIYMSNVFYGHAPEMNGLFLLNLDSSDTHVHNIDAKRIKLNDNSTYMWHCRLGHIGVKRMKKLHSDGLLESLDRCEACLMGKMTKTPFSGTMERATDLLEIIHTDVCGPMSVASRGGYRYVLTFTDDLSRYGYIYFMKHKSETFEKFKEFQSEVENQRNKKIKFLRSDRGGEYLSYEFGMHLKKCGILSQLTPPGTPQRNGVSERRNRTLLDMVRSMMSLTDLPLSFWGYALETAAFTLNRAPSKSVETTPYELWFGKKPKLSFLKVWGCDAYVKKLQPDKLEPKAEKCVFIGYPKETIGYTFYHRSEGKIFVAKNGSFLEKEFLTKEVTGRKVELDEVDEPSLIDQSSAVPEEVPVQPTPIGEEANDDDHETSNEEATEPRRSTRERTTPDWYDPCLNVMIVDNNDEDPATYEEAMMSPDSNKWQETMKSEMGSMYDNKVWTLVDLPDSRKAVENKWIFKRKTDADGNITVYKARLVAKGFRQIQGVDYDETFSPVAKLKSVRILLAIAAFFDYEIWQMDVKTAFLNGDIEEELYMVQPKGFVDPKNADKVCKLQRSIYGLKQASRSWNLLKRVIKDFGFIRTHGEACIYKKVSGSSVVPDII
ncbi:hypothetical protein QYE76_019920, partial [Lolium multiflorum]